MTDFDALRRRLGEEEKPLVEALRTVGVQVESVWELSSARFRYTEALPVLMEHLRRPYPPAIREGIARALAVKEARPFWSSLVELFVATPAEEERVKDGVACALGFVDETVLRWPAPVAKRRVAFAIVNFHLAGFPRSTECSGYVSLLVRRSQE